MWFDGFYWAQVRLETPGNFYNIHIWAEHIYEGAWQLIICQPFVDIHTKVLSLRNHKGRSMVFLPNGGEAMLAKGISWLFTYNSKKYFWTKRPNLGGSWTSNTIEINSLSIWIKLKGQHIYQQIHTCGWKLRFNPEKIFCNIWQLLLSKS